MKRGMMTLLAMLAMAALLAAGCANTEAVKAEEPVVAPAQTEAPKVEAAQPEASAVPATPTTVEAPTTEEAKPAAAVEASFETAYFDFDKSDLRQDARDVLSKNADIMLKTKTDVNVKIEGHCDERGSNEYNLALGERRAKSALQYLVTLGVPANRLSTVSYGEEKPAVEGHNEDAWAKNRRAEFVINK